MEIKKEVLTKEIKQTLDPREIIYAEYATPGAMGCCGSAVMYVLHNGQMHYFHGSYFSKDEAQKESYHLLSLLLNRCFEDGQIAGIGGGYGNYAYKKKGIHFARDDENITLIYSSSGKNYHFEVSSLGVYKRIVDELAEPSKI